MYKKHRDFCPPPQSATLWRYMDFTKYISLLESESLFFSRTNYLGDPFEGTVSRANLSARERHFSRLGKKPKELQNYLQFFPALKEYSALNSMVSCWHESNCESEAMWKLYCRESGVGVRTSFKKLSDSFVCEDPIYIGRVRYVNYIDTIISEHNTFVSLLTKRESFAHEHEVRAITSVLEEFPGTGTLHDLQSGISHLKSTAAPGKYISVNISTLIEEVITSPSSPEWFIDLVNSVSSRYNLSAPISKSSLDVDPLW